MDFDIDAVLDQLEKTLNQSDHDEEKSNQIFETPSTLTNPRKSVDELLLLDLDPFGNIENSNYNDIKQENDNKINDFKKDLEELYATSTTIDQSSIEILILPDVINQNEDLSKTSYPLAVEQLENQVRQEILHHTIEQSTSVPLLLPDLTNLSNDIHNHKKESVLVSTAPNLPDKENLSSIPIDETNKLTFQNEPDIIQHDIPPVLHSVDSIVNAPVVSDLDNFISRNPILVENEDLESSTEAIVFSACNDDNEEEQDDEKEKTVELLFDEIQSNNPIDLPLITSTTMDTSTQGFDLVKNVLSEIFDKPDEEILDEQPVEEKQSELIHFEQQEIPLELQEATTTSTLPTNNDEDFRFLDDMLASIDTSDSEIHQLTPAEIERVDNLLKQIVNAQKTESNATSSEINERESIPTISSSEQPLFEPSLTSVSSAEIETSTVAASSLPTDDELIRVEREWAKLTEEEKRLGSVAPEWVNDDQAPICMKCSMKFSITRRRHHCRACGKVFCSACCWQKIKLIHDDSKEDRTCNDCIKTIQNVEYLWNYMRNNQKPRSSVLRKRTGQTSLSGASEENSLCRQGSEHKKSVTFHDSVKPGVETNVSTAASIAATNIMSTNKTRINEIDTDQITVFKPEQLTPEQLEEKLQLLKDPNQPPVEFHLHKNLTVMSKILDNFDCYLNRNGGYSWIFFTRGLCTVAQDEIIFIFDENPIDANEIINDLLIHINQIYIDATKGSFVRHLSLSLTTKSSFLSSSRAGGFVYLSDPTVSFDLFPEASYLFGILIHRSELPTAQCFPMRLLLRLGYEYQSYPWPLFSILKRDSMFNDTQHTIMSLLCDFRSFTYVLPTIRGLLISVGLQGSVSIRIPRNRHDDILKSLEQSSPHALSFGIMNVDRQIHSKHLVTIENSTDQQYETRLFSSLNSTNEQITVGGNFLVINASLRSRDSPSSSPLDTQTNGSFSSNNNLNAKVNTIEDGIMLQIDSDVLKILKQCLKERKDYAILAKARSIMIEEQKDSINGNIMRKTTSEQLVEFLWIDDDNDFNRGVRSPIDHFPMDGIRNSRIHYAGQRSPLIRLRWTDLFFIECHLSNNESLDPTRLADSLAKAFTQALTPFIDMLIEAKYYKLSLRVTIDRENASYLAGSNGEQLPPFFLSQLDDHMIPIVMKASDNVSRTAPSLVLELVFYLLD